MPSELEIVKDTSVFPYSIICHQDIKRKRKVIGTASYSSTGFLIGPNVLLTAAHNLYSPFLTKVNSITLTPGRNKDEQSFDAVNIPGLALCNTCIRVHPKFGWNKSGFDFAIVLIPREITDKLHNWPRDNFFVLDKDTPLEKGDTIFVAGYPASNGYDGSLMTTQHQKCGTVSADTFLHDLDTQTGNSGSPIWIEKDGLRQVVGVHTYAGIGTRITNEDIDLIQTWIQEFNQP